MTDRLLTPEERKEIIETWHRTVEPYLDGLNSIEAEEKLKELPDVYENLCKAQLAKAKPIIAQEVWTRYRSGLADTLSIAVEEAKREERERIKKIIDESPYPFQNIKTLELVLQALTEEK